MNQIDIKVKRYRLLSNIAMVLLFILLPIQVWRVISDYSWQKVTYLILLIFAFLITLYVRFILYKIKLLMEQRRE